MKWLKNKLRAWVFETDESDSLVKATRPNRTMSVGPRTFESRGMGFTIYHANGGSVLEYTTYDSKTDRHDHKLHIIPSDQDLGQGIAHIITLEMLRK